MSEIKSKKIFLTNSFAEALPKNGLIFSFDNNIKIDDLYKVFAGTKNTHLKQVQNFINFKSLLNLVFSEKKKLISLINFLKIIHCIDYKFTDSDISEISVLSKIENIKLRNELFCNFSDGQKIKIILVILKYFKNQNIFIDYLIIKKIDVYSKDLILNALALNNKVFISNTNNNVFVFKNSYFILYNENKLQLLELNKNNKYQYFKYVNKFDQKAGIIEKIDFKFLKNKINIFLTFKKDKKFTFFRYYLNLALSELVLGSVCSELIKKKDKSVTHKFSIDLESINQFVGNIQLKVVHFNNISLKNKKINRYNLLFLHLSKFKKNKVHYLDNLFLNCSKNV